MKKVLISIFAVAVLTGCSGYYDYYKGGVRYTQDGSDCIFRAGEQGNRFSNDIDHIKSGKVVVYRNTMCADLYKKDMGEVTEEVKTAPVVAKPVVFVAAPVAKKSCCAKTTCAKQNMTVKRRIVIVPAY